MKEQSDDDQDKLNAVFVYSVQILKVLFQLKLITKQEYVRIIKYNAEYYACNNLL